MQEDGRALIRQWLATHVALCTYSATKNGAADLYGHAVDGLLRTARMEPASVVILVALPVCIVFRMFLPAHWERGPETP